MQRPVPAVAVADELVAEVFDPLADDRPDHRVEPGAVASAGEHADPHRRSLEQLAGRGRRAKLSETEGSEMSDSVDLDAVRTAQQKTWSEGDFAMVANLVMMPSEQLAESLEIVPGERVLDVACGSGNAALAAARRSWGNVVGVDFVPALLERGRERAAAERLDVEFVEGDAAELPFGEAEFDVVTSVFGAMFAPDQEKTAAELLRVCKPGGRIGMGNWTPGRRRRAACS